MSREKGKENTPPTTIEEIVKRHEAGESVPALAREYAMPFKTVRNMVYRERRKQKEFLEIGRLPGERKHGRKPSDILQEYKNENSRLKMENELLRDFLLAAGKK